MAKGVIIAAPRSGSGKTLVTLGLLGALRRRGLAVAPAKTGPDYIDTAILGRVAGREAINLDPWAMSAGRLRALASAAGDSSDLLLVEGVMGLFDGAADGKGSTGDLAAALDVPVVLVVDAEKQSQSIAALVHGFATWRAEVTVAGVIVNRVATMRHERMLRAAIAQTGIAWLGAVPRKDDLVMPERHLGLVLPGEMDGFDGIAARAADLVGEYADLDALLALAGKQVDLRAAPPPQPLPSRGRGRAEPQAGEGAALPVLAPLGQHIAIARDDAFAFIYAHMLADWRGQGATLSFFSPLADEAPDASADAVFLPGGYPELYGAKLAAAERFKAGLVAAQKRGALIYGECGGFMVLGQSLTDKAGTTHAMAGLLPVSTSIDRPKRALGYRRLVHNSPLPWPERLYGHEFHYSEGRITGAHALFAATDALGETQPPMGAQVGRVMGSYAHVIDVA